MAGAKAKSSDWLVGIPVQTPPSELRKANREKLVGIGISPNVIDLFEGNTVYSPGAGGFGRLAACHFKSVTEVPGRSYFG